MTTRRDVTMVRKVAPPPLGLRSQPWRAAYEALSQCSMVNYANGCGNPVRHEERMMDWLRRLGRSRLWDFGAVVIALLGLIHLVMALPERMRKEDFSHYYVAHQLVFDTDNPYTYPVEPLYEQHGLAGEGALPHITDP